MNRLSMTRCLQGLIPVLAAAGALAILPATFPARQGDAASAAKELAKLDEDWSKAATERNAEHVASFYAEDGIAYPPSKPLAVGRAAVKKAWALYYLDPSRTISRKTVHSGVSASGELGFTAGTYEDSYKARDGKMSNEKGKYVCTWRKGKDGTWEAIHDIWNSDSR